MLVVAHRLQTVMNADLIAVLDAGRVVQAGAKDGGLTYWGSSQFLEGSLKFSLGGDEGQHCGRLRMFMVHVTFFAKHLHWVWVFTNEEFVSSGWWVVISCASQL